jgi:hypothetical protein
MQAILGASVMPMLPPRRHTPTATRTREVQASQRKMRLMAKLHILAMPMCLLPLMLGATDLIYTALAPCHKYAVNDDGTVLTVTDGMFAQLCLDFNNKVDDPDALLAKFKAACAVEATAEANNGTYAYDAFTS